MIYIVNKVGKYRKYRDNQVHIDNKDREAKKYAFVALLGLLIFLGFNFNTLPIFMDGGSDAMVALGEKQKINTWFMYGMLSMLSTLLLFSIVSIKSKGGKYIYGFVLLLFSLVTGKKAALISFHPVFKSYEKNLIKIGSTAPNDVLRTIYEQSILAGDVTNTSGDIQIHNFVNK